MAGQIYRPVLSRSHGGAEKYVVSTAYFNSPQVFIRYTVMGGLFSTQWTTFSVCPNPPPSSCWASA